MQTISVDEIRLKYSLHCTDRQRTYASSIGFSMRNDCSVLDCLSTVRRPMVALYLSWNLMDYLLRLLENAIQSDQLLCPTRRPVVHESHRYLR